MTDRVIAVDYEKVNQMAVDGRNEAKYKASLGKKFDENAETLDKPMNAKLVKALGKKRPHSSTSGAPKSKASGMMNIDGLDDTSSEDADAPKAKKQKTAQNAQSTGSTPSELTGDDLARHHRSVYITGLPHDAKDEDVETLFTDAGEIRSCKVFMRGAKCRGSATLEFAAGTDADTAVAKAASTPLLFRGAGSAPLSIAKGFRAAGIGGVPGAPAGAPEVVSSWAPSGEGTVSDGKTVYVKGDLHGTTALGDLLDGLAICGEVVHGAVTQTKKGAIVQFAEAAHAQASLGLTGIVVNGAEINITMSKISYDDWHAQKHPKKSTAWKKRGAHGDAQPPAPAAPPASVADAAPDAGAPKQAAENSQSAPVAQAPKKKAFSFKPRSVAVKKA
eukprot:Rhum_TRINITY_DN23301_c0_g1::Rhum_TRINITY_DN23301_c0_g1_i1::g.177650::m.177650